MLRFFEPKDRFNSTSSKIPSSSKIPPLGDVEPPPQKVTFTKGSYLESDPFKRTQILDYHPNDQDEVRRAYLAKGPTKPKLGKYPTKLIVRTKKHKTFRFVYRLVKLALTLPVATATVERVFSGLNYVKNVKRNKMANPWLNDCLVTYVEKEVFSSIDDMDIIKRFQAMTKRRMQLP